MVKTLPIVLVCLCICVTTNAQEGGGLFGGAPAKEAEVGAKASRVREVVALRHMPAADLTKTLSAMLRDDDELDVLIVPEMISNSLLLAGTADDVKQARALIDQLDQAPKMVRISVTIAEVQGKGDVIDLAGPAAEVLEKVEELEADGKVGVMNRISLTTIDNQAAYVQLGQTKPVVTGRTRSSLGYVNSVRDTAVGLIVKATPRVNGDNSVVMKLDVEKSWIESDDKVDLGGDADGDRVPASTVFTATSQSTITVPDGKVVVVSGAASSTDSQTKQLLFLVSTDILK